MADNILPVLKTAGERARYCIQVNDFRISFPSDDSADYENIYEYQFDYSDCGVISNPEYTGEISPLWGMMSLIVGDLKVDYPTWNSSFSVAIWPKSDMAMLHECWLSEADIKGDILRLFYRDVEKYKEYPDVYFPSVASDVDVLNVNGRLWGHVSALDFRQRDFFFFELDRNLVVKIGFDASACWHRNGFAPPDVKAHIMTFFMDYLQHVQVVEIGSVPDDQLPPLGFYPAEREEKEIDADGKTIGKEPEIQERYDPLGW